MHHADEFSHNDLNGQSGKIKVLMYHRIVDDPHLASIHWTCLPAEDFRRHLQLLDRWGFTAITFNDYRLYLIGELNLPRKPVILTFDDGYLDTYRIAFRMLRDFGMKAVVFAVADRRMNLNLWDKHTTVPSSPLLQRHHLNEMAKEGFEIGSHSFSHARLTELREDDAWQEISHSKLVLEIMTGGPVLSFSYPYGLVTRRVKEFVKEAGYTIGCGVFTGPPSFGADLFEVRRMTMRNTTSPVGFGFRLLMPFQRYEFARWRAQQALMHHPSNGSREHKKHAKTHQEG